MKRIFAILLLLVVSLSAKADFIKGRVLVTLTENTDEVAQNFVHAYRANGMPFLGTWKRIGSGKTIIVDVGAGSEIHALSALRNASGVEFAELDEIMAPCETPNDEYYANQWHLPNIGLPAAWDLVTGGNVIVGVLDTGCDPTHPDLIPNIVGGWNEYDNTADYSDVHGHGTHVAGVCGAAGNNTIGVCGAFWSCKLFPIRVTDPTGYASFGTVANAVYRAQANGCRIVTISFSNAANSGTILSAGQWLYQKGGLMFIAAGNTGSLLDFPDNKYVVTVGSTNSSNVRSSFSSYGGFLDLMTPGENIWSTRKGGGYGGGTGTSFASPMAAGVAALMFAVNPAISNTQVRECLYQTAVDLGETGRDIYYGWGKIDAYAAVLLALNPPSVPDDIPPDGYFVSPRQGQKITRSKNVITEVSATDNVGVASVSLALNGVPVSTLTTAPYSWTFSANAFTSGSNLFTATIKDAAGNSKVITVSVKK